VIGKFLLKHVLGPLVGTVAAKAGEAIGDRLAYKINPPDEPDTETVEVIPGACDRAEGCLRVKDHPGPCAVYPEAGDESATD
jgi:hypothetical protein